MGNLQTFSLIFEKNRGKIYIRVFIFIKYVMILGEELSFLIKAHLDQTKTKFFRKAVRKS